ncbi:uncharacterized protein LOC131945920 [Physella acuta]|uniref:uncharacterized protein LOC131945920 n=1 Tax=Physella acuta TaxID=109671 RepID=UPI0027DE4C6E|nr:uncharacterized protein LOC131945920 [Physella acuta]
MERADIPPVIEADHPNTDTGLIKVAVYWDIENIQIPKGESVARFKELVDEFMLTKQDISEELKYEVDTFVACAANFDRLNVKEEDFERLKIRMVTVAQERNSADKKIFELAGQFCSEYKNFAQIWIISSDQKLLRRVVQLARRQIATFYFIFEKGLIDNLNIVVPEDYRYSVQGIWKRTYTKMPMETILNDTELMMNHTVDVEVLKLDLKEKVYIVDDIEYFGMHAFEIKFSLDAIVE